MRKQDRWADKGTPVDRPGSLCTGWILEDKLYLLCSAESDISPKPWRGSSNHSVNSKIRSTDDKSLCVFSEIIRDAGILVLVVRLSYNYTPTIRSQLRENQINPKLLTGRFFQALNSH